MTPNGDPKEPPAPLSVAASGGVVITPTVLVPVAPIAALTSPCDPVELPVALPVAVPDGVVTKPELLLVLLN